MGLLLHNLIMGNEISHKKYCCGTPGPAAEQSHPALDLPAAQSTPGAVLRSSASCPAKERSQITATGVQDKEVGRESEIASCSQPAAQVMERTTELQDLGEAQACAEQAEETANKPATTVTTDRQTCAPAQERPATAQRAEGDRGVMTTDFSLQAATKEGARDGEDGVTDQARMERNSVVSKRLCKPSPLCRWLKKLKSPAGKAQVKPNATNSQE